MKYQALSKISLNSHPELTERWVQERIAENPQMLGLGDVVLKDKERIQPRAARLDLLLQDAEANHRYEVEIQLGKKETIPRPQYNGVSKIYMCPYLNSYGKFLESLSFVVVSFFAKKYGKHKSIPSLFFKATMIDRCQAQACAALDPYYLVLLSNLELVLSR